MVNIRILNDFDERYIQIKTEKQAKTSENRQKNKINK